MLSSSNFNKYDNKVELRTSFENSEWPNSQCYL